MQDDAERMISVVVSAPSEDEDPDQKGIFRRRRDDELLVKPLPLGALSERISNVAGDIDAVVARLRERSDDGFRLTEVTVQLEITAEGGVNLIGTATVGASAGITLTFAV